MRKEGTYMHNNKPNELIQLNKFNLTFLSTTTLKNKKYNQPDLSTGPRLS